MRRYGHCVSDLPPLRDYSLNETDFLAHQIRVFLDQGNYDNEQLANLSALMDNICRINDSPDSNYPISVHIDVNKYSNTNNSNVGKENRCKAIDEAMDSMYYVFRRAAWNRSEPLDFSVIHYYPNATNKAASYNLTDLINTSWIKSDTILEHVCSITDSVKSYIRSRSSNSTAQDRSQQQSSGVWNNLIELLDRLLDPILGFNERLLWEGSNRLEIIQTRIANGLGSIRDGLTSRYKTTREQVSGLFSNRTNGVIETTKNTTRSSNVTTIAVPLLANRTIAVNETVGNLTRLTS